MELRVETHCHTYVSDGSASPEALLRSAEKKKIDVIAVTDHGSFRGSVLAHKYARLIGSPVSVIFATEAYTSWGDILVYCTAPLPEPLPRDPFELRDLASAYNCLMTAPHPFHPFMPGVKGKLYEAPQVFDMVEVWNGRSMVMFNLLAFRAAKKLGKPGISGSDAHVPSAVGTAPSLVYASSASPEDVLEAMRKGKALPTLGIYSLPNLFRDAAWSIYRKIG
ncbi:MAG: PHP domain-containing protein [Acidilobaceae archaeon]|nr:PHP domain-containing protein [Acidilobaceae archaeon]MCX8166030.1 PHP domain-containing protein [Acidilobaceae archaeon]MDW7974673.1 PHP-associated domain-containing protein [Sulfolobales archaeon]